MYSRPREDFGISLPGDYCGTAFNDEEASRTDRKCEEMSESPSECLCDGKSERHRGRASTGISSMFSDLPLFSGLSSLGLTVPKFGAEDILIIATAAFLFFSKSGDKECAIMLLLLIFIAN